MQIKWTFWVTSDCAKGARKSGRKLVLKFSPQADFNFVQPWLDPCEHIWGNLNHNTIFIREICWKWHVKWQPFASLLICYGYIKLVANSCIEFDPHYTEVNFTWWVAPLTVSGHWFCHNLLQVKAPVEGDFYQVLYSCILNSWNILAFESRRAEIDNCSQIEQVFSSRFLLLSSLTAVAL